MDAGQKTGIEASSLAGRVNENHGSLQLIIVTQRQENLYCMLAVVKVTPGATKQLKLTTAYLHSYTIMLMEPLHITVLWTIL